MINRYIVSVIVLITLFITPAGGIYFLPAACIYLLFLDSKLFRFIVKWSFALFAFILLVVQPLLAMEKNMMVAGIPVSSEGFFNGVMMLGRAILIISSINYLSVSLNKEKAVWLSSRLGIKNYDEIVSLGGKMIPSVKSSAISFLTSRERKRSLNPVESAARLIVILIRLSRTY